MPKYRLLARAEWRGAIRDPGFVFDLEDGEKGPHRTVVASNHGAQITDRMNEDTRLEDVPLYEEVKDAAPAEAVAAPDPISDEHAADRARIVDLERELADKDRQLGESHARLAAIEGALHNGDPLLLEAPIGNLPAKS